MNPSIVALHGFTGRGSDFDLIKAKSRFPLVALALKETFKANRECLDQVAPGNYLLGYSMGARVALNYAIHMSRKLLGLILVGATPGIQDAKERKLRVKSDAQWIHLLEEQGLESFLKAWQKQPIIQSQAEILDFLRENRLKNTKDYLVKLLKNMGTGQMLPCWNLLKTIECPVLLVVGEKDEKFKDIAKKMTLSLKCVQYLEIPRVGHCAHLENTDFFCEYLDKFIEKNQKSVNVQE